ncbi:hypothetical protein [Amycolatopsis sp. YIM 10]|uniref:hypothetical protein n=1 Tax=Amycolatopsis sp. YIM 10 TaxID=2653857 RepID=UPI001290285A|nr:hypothetical protein [Amycolatopsis sp. YIM 10]QFU93866.1 hypothetical protein YIM_43660 [Amycolatopsis sp. YIM 10]
MNGRIDSTGTGTGHGRHRRGSGTWTPAVPHAQGHHSHRAYGGTGTLEPPVQRTDPGFHASRGELPISARADYADFGARAELGTRADQGGGAYSGARPDFGGGAYPGARTAFGDSGDFSDFADRGEFGNHGERGGFGDRGEVEGHVDQADLADTAPLAPPVLPSQRGEQRPPTANTADVTGPVRRTKVTLTPPTPPAPEEEDAEDEARIYLAPPVDGLSTFDLGSVPASVTPPRTWRKAAWFAAASSGGVVVAMLCAGSFLVGQPPASESRAINGWLGENGGGGHPLVQGDLPLPGDGTGTGTSNEPPATDDTGTTDPSLPGSDLPTSGGRPGTSTGDAPSSVGGGRPTTSPTGPGSGQPDSSKPQPELQKPPSKPAKREFEKQRYWTSNDPKTMADHSEKFFNTVTEDPGSAAALTEGELQQEGASGLRESYSDVAYFEVKHIYVDPNDGVTVNTVEVTHTDGSKSTEQRTLVFSENDKITNDGR